MLPKCWHVLAWLRAPVAVKWPFEQIVWRVGQPDAAMLLQMLSGQGKWN